MDFKKYLEKQQFSHHTITGYLKVNELLMLWLKEEGIKPENTQYADMLAYMRYVGNKGHSKRYINEQLTVARHYFNFLIKIGKIKDNVAANIHVQGVSRRLPHDLLDQETLQNIFENYPVKSLTDKRNKVMLGMVIYQGLNTEELGKLEPEHIQLQNGKLYVPGGRRSNSRLLPLAAHQVLQIQEYTQKVRPLILEINKKKSEKLFVSNGSGVYINNTISKMMKVIQSYAPEVKSMKQLRRSVLTFWLEKFNLREVQYMAGHRYVSSTERYFLTNLDDLQNDLNEYHPL